MARLGFDATIIEIWPYLTAGATICLPDFELPIPAQDLRTQEILEAEALRKVDLAQDSLTQFILLEGEAGHYVFIVNIHYIVFDSWSLGIFLKELSPAYEARCRKQASNFNALPAQYSDFAVAQKAWMQEFLEAQQLPYWLERLANLPTLRLPTDHSRPPIQSFRGASQSLKLSVELTRSLEVFCRQENDDLNTDLVEPATVERLLRHYHRILQEVSLVPDRPVSQLPLLDDSERAEILWRGRGRENCAITAVHVLFEEQARQRPEQTALIYNGAQVSYGELNERANRLVRLLCDRGVQPGMAVTVNMEHQAEMIVALLAILKTGGFYVALDPGNPTERNEFILEDVGAALTLITAKGAGCLTSDVHSTVVVDEAVSLLALQLAENLDIPVNTNVLCYIAYTSGSTGQPKGVSILHRGVVCLVSKPNYVHLNQSERLLCFAPLAFDASTFEIWGYCTTERSDAGHCSPEQTSLAALGNLIQEQKVTTAWLTAGLFHLFVKERPDDLCNLRQLLAGGDVLQPTAVNRAFNHFKGVLINGYGPTENTTFTCCHRMYEPEKFGENIPIGKAISGTQIYVLDECLELVPFGAVGELYVGGNGLARDYWQRPDLPVERFLASPFAEAAGLRMYRTGDLVRMRPDSVVEFLGRVDDMVKIRGFRIEPGEIESALASHPSVAETVVLLPAIGEEKRLIGYVVPHSETTDAGEAARRKVGEWSRAFDDLIYKDIEQAKDSEFNTAGWISGYTNETIPDAEMDVWVRDRVESIAQQRPRRIVELGCGTGLLLLRLASGTTS